MKGGRHIDWSHIRVDGDRDAAAPYVGEARKLMGAVMEDAAVNGLGVHSMHKTLPDGTVLIAEKHGEIPRMTIVPVSVSDDGPRMRPPDDFVVWARTAELPDGIDEDRPQQILRAAWKTYFNAADTAGHDEFPGRKGVYGGVFPAGLLYAGNVDWKHKNGSRMSWYGPSSRYWYDAWRDPWPQYGKHVFQLGKIVLDVDAYCAEADVDLAERWVLGAAQKGAKLLVVMAALPQYVTWPTPPATAAFTPDAWSTPLYPIEGVPVVLRSFLLSPDAGASLHQRVVAGSHEDLWAGEVARGAAPWHFNEEADAAVSHVPPVEPRLYQRGAGNWVRPSASHTRLELREDEGGWDLDSSEVGLPAGAGVGVIAEDGQHTLEVRRTVVDGDPNGLAYRLGGHSYPAFMSRFQSGGSRYIRRQIMWADLREGVLLLWSEEAAGEFPPWTFTASVVLCKAGVEQTVWADSNTVSSFLEGDVIRLNLDRLAAAPVAPLALAHLLPMGAMTDAGGVGTFDAGMSLLNQQRDKPARKSDYYSQVVYAFSAGPWTHGQLAEDVAQDIASNTQVDALGRHTHPSFASSKGWTLASYPMNSGINGRRVVLHHAANGEHVVDLAALTGVAGSDVNEGGRLGYDARYHPTWLLGQPPTSRGDDGA